MRILLAAPDRDLLECYKIILGSEFGETVTAFDGTQVVSLLSNEEFGLAVLDCGLPRIDRKNLVLRMRTKNLPVIALTNSPLNVRRITEEPPANAYIAYPFTPGQLTEAVRNTLALAESGEKLHIFDTVIDVPAFRTESGLPLTAGEIGVLQALVKGERLKEDSQVYVVALNERFAKSGIKTRIRYIKGKGYEAVKEDE